MKVYDYSKLSGRIVEKCGTQSAFAKKMGISERTVSLKLNNKIYFKQNEIENAMNILDLSFNQIPLYFLRIKI